MVVELSKSPQGNSSDHSRLLKSNIRQSAIATTVRILIFNNSGTAITSGSGVIVGKLGNIYTVLTNLHVLQFADRAVILTSDGLSHSLISKSHTAKFGDNDMAIAQFQSSQQYEVAQIKPESLQVGDRVFAAGFPIYRDRSLVTTFELGLQDFRFTEGIVSILPAKSLTQGYKLGYSNDIVVGMSGGPIFDASGFLVGINGRIKNRDPDFGGYTFDDGTEPSPMLLQQMLKASWGVPINAYLQFMSINSH
ncbi:MAG: serine protease [Pseudanabaenaceae cyanobacterium bins.39]|nr:serine protease [Pseudanabaenaceae cyanobacterium bins.39]